MKVTSFEISRKLSLIDFERPLIGVASLYDAVRGELIESLNEEEKTGETIAAYDLETILEALPKEFLDEGITYFFEICVSVHDRFILRYDGVNDSGILESTNQGEEESLANTAARLLLLLHEKNLIKF